MDKLKQAYEFYDLEIPEGLKEPELHDVELFYWNAFWLLHTERMAGTELWYIPHSKIIELHKTGIYGDDKATFIDIIRAMDAVYMQKSKASSTETKGK